MILGLTYEQRIYTRGRGKRSGERNEGGGNQMEFVLRAALVYNHRYTSYTVIDTITVKMICRGPVVVVLTIGDRQGVLYKRYRVNILTNGRTSGRAMPTEC